ncbi:radical SAM domain-containing protein [Desulfonema ishimotonii]|uniref:Radical SAM domain-containing protein n=1 Tax=Desulfonema ishimotonii TaxID=45657 RepID=A0A401G0H9_9BACT|nr:radical SAM protein [Desulfonema ishimotonii]GBC62724.1 radical SAM domain-containing protein [Desulfonema ishimotonii]
MTPGEKTFIVPVFIPHAGCPHRCAFCDQSAITHVPSELPSPERLLPEIRKFLTYKKADRKTAQISFYGGNFLGLPADTVRDLLCMARQFVVSGAVDSLRFSTRPDTITPERLALLNDFPVATVEIGLQSMNDRVLALSGRGHTAADTRRAVGLLREKGYEIGLQMMVGLPGDSTESALATGREIVRLAPDFVRIYPTLVLENSRLARWYRSGKYTPLPLADAVSLVKRLCLMFTSAGIRVIRMGLQASETLDRGGVILAGPYHPAFGHLVCSEIFLDRAIILLKSHSGPRYEIVLAVHPRSISEMRGLRNKNVEILRTMFNIRKLNILPDPSLSETDIRLRSGSGDSAETAVEQTDCISTTPGNGGRQV